MPKNNSNTRKEQRRIAAEVRQEDYDALTPDEKLARVEARSPGVEIKATNEYLRLKAAGLVK